MLLVMWRVYMRNHPTMGPWVQRIEHKPGWVYKLAILSAALTIGVPLALLALAAVLVGMVTFIVFSAIATMVAVIIGWFAGSASTHTVSDNHRVNVRVIRHDRL